MNLDAAGSFTILLHGQALVLTDAQQLPQLPEHPDDLLVCQTAQQRIVTRAIAAEQCPAGHQWVPIRQIISHLNMTQFERISRAMQLLDWQKTHRFCGACGSTTVAHAAGEMARICPDCGHSAYPRINPCVIVAIVREQRILLARAQRYTVPMFSLIAGFVEVGETLEQAVARETLEEVGLTIKNLRYVTSQPWPFPSNLMLGFIADYDSGDLVLQEDEIAEADWFAFDQLPMIPPKGSIAYQLIQQVTQNSAV